LPYTDQFVFQQLLEFGQKITSISISKAIEVQGRAPRFNGIYGFYIKRSRNSPTPPIRAGYLESKREGKVRRSAEGDLLGVQRLRDKRRP
jgi:hypothetical protein